MSEGLMRSQISSFILRTEYQNTKGTGILGLGYQLKTIHITEENNLLQSCRTNYVSASSGMTVRF